VSLAWAGALATLVTTTLMAIGLGFGPQNLLAGRDGPSAAAVAEDFSSDELIKGIGHDGQQFYAIARSFPHVADAEPYLDRPLYRLQRPFLPFAAWVLSAGQRGTPMVVAMFAASASSVIVGALGLRSLGLRFGGSPVAAPLFVVLPATWMSIMHSLSDGMAVGLALGALGLLASTDPRCRVAGVVMGSCAVLTKESVALVLVGWMIARRDRWAVAACVIGGVSALGWRLSVRTLVTDNAVHNSEVGLPFVGWWDAWHVAWSTGQRPLSTASAIVVALVLLSIVARPRFDHPLWWVAACNGVLVLVMSQVVLDVNINLMRAALPMMAAALPVILPGFRSAPDGEL
jgi:hypothetical protein